MSKTDKDKPYKVRAREGGIERHLHYSWRGEELACDLETANTPPRRYRSCQYVLGPEYGWGLGPAPSWYVTETYHRPERSRARITLDALRREYNGEGELEDGDVACRQARNEATWRWW